MHECKKSGSAQRVLMFQEKRAIDDMLNTKVSLSRPPVEIGTLGSVVPPAIKRTAYAYDAVPHPARLHWISI